MRKDKVSESPDSAEGCAPSIITARSPFYYQLADILREAIDRGTWQVDELIPAEGTLTEMFGISRSVTRKALDLLEGEGRVLRVKGKGTLVVGPKFAYEAVDAAGSWFARRSQPLRLGKIIKAGRSAAGGNLGKLLGLLAER